MSKKNNISVFFFFAASFFILIENIRADDPLDQVDGTEGWNEIDTSSVDESSAWQTWRLDLRRWEAGRARIEAERVSMSRAQRRDEPVPLETDTGQVDTSEADWQTQIDDARRHRQDGEDIRDNDGQTLDEERPWSRR